MELVAEDFAPNRTIFSTWTPREIEAAYTGKGQIRFSVPPFQRDFVWNRDQQGGFIDSLKAGVPVGCLLLYTPPDEPNKRYIVDGLQRSTTIVKYLGRMFSFVKPDTLPFEDIERLANHLIPDHQLASDEERAAYRVHLKERIAQWFHGVTGTDAASGYDYFSLWQHLHAKPIMGKPLESGLPPDLVRPVLGAILDHVRKSLSIDNASIPVIEFSGHQGQLPLIFERINSEGTKLNKFDILAAQWDEASVTFDQQDIAKAVETRYKELKDLGLEYEGDNESVIEGLSAREHAFYIYEFVLGLGRVLKRDYPGLYGAAKEASSSVDSIGFNLSALVADLPIAQLGRLRGYLVGAFRKADDDRDPNVSAFATLLDEASGYVLGWLSSALSSKLFAHERKKFPHSEFFVAALVACVARDLVSDHKPFRRLDSEASVKQLHALEELVPQRYWYEQLRQQWRGSGDSKAYRFVHDRSHLQRISGEDFALAMDAWYENLRTSKRTNLDPVSRGLLALLISASGVVLAAKPEITHLYGGSERQWLLGNVTMVVDGHDLLAQLGAPVSLEGSKRDEVVASRYDWIKVGVLRALFG